ncbi:hypothetical protein A9Q79_03685 [Methylophaga sp. 42_25_T18]|nr:hypothetical protein A9Q79_03685 [Methylophaga sp. 42_25_T18]
MQARIGFISLATSLLFVMSQPVLAKEYISQNTATNVIELYTSEGCSSCPPADKWLSQLKTQADLFKRFIPMAFHVDYWNQLGWTDRFSNKANSQRQYIHQQEGNISQVYTPGIMLNNKEWRGWHSGKKSWNVVQNAIGILKVNHDEESQQLRINFSPEHALDEQQMQLNIVILGMGISNEIKTGENRGRQLNHDFVVLNHVQKQVSIDPNNDSQKWQASLPNIPASGQQQSALVVWLSAIHSQDIIQATGGYL